MMPWAGMLGPFGADDTGDRATGSASVRAGHNPKHWQSQWHTLNRETKGLTKH